MYDTSVRLNRRKCAINCLRLECMLYICMSDSKLLHTKYEVQSKRCALGRSQCVDPKRPRSWRTVELRGPCCCCSKPTRVQQYYSVCQDVLWASTSRERETPTRNKSLEKSILTQKSEISCALLCTGVWSWVDGAVPKPGISCFEVL